MFPLYSRLIELKKSNEALWNGPYGGKLIMLDTKNGRNTIAYIRQKVNSKVLVVINLSGHNQFAHLNDLQLEGHYHEIFSDERFTIYDDYYFNLGPWGYKVLLSK